MPSNPLLGKFGPIVLLVVVQLVLVLAAPSTAPTANTAALGASGSPYATTPQGSVPAGSVPGAVTAGGAAAPGAAAGGGGGSTVAGGSTYGGTTGTPGTSGGGGGVAVGDTKHCVAGRQFNPKIDYYAPPCVAGLPGAAYPNNGGATWPGVTDKQIEVVNYVADYGAEVDAILKAQGLYYDASQAKQWNEAYAKFISSHFQLYGRTLR